MSSKKGLRTLIVGCLRVHIQGLVPNNAEMSQKVLFIHIADVLFFLQLSEIQVSTKIQVRVSVQASK